MFSPLYLHSQQSVTRFRELVSFCARKLAKGAGNPQPPLPGPGGSGTATCSGIERDGRRPLPGQRNAGITEQDREDVAEATAKKLGSFGLEVST